MNIKEWEKQREKDIERGGYSPLNIIPIQINITDKEILKVLKDYDLKELDENINEEFFGLKNDIKAAIYRGDLQNEKKNITNFIIEKDSDLKKQFPKFFWAEYVANEMYERNYTFEEMINYCGLMGDIFNYLKKHKKYQGITGEEYQSNVRLNKEIEDLTGMRFSWRAWGALMAAFMNTKEKERKYQYMDFYMQKNEHRL